MTLIDFTQRREVRKERVESGERDRCCRRVRPIALELLLGAARGALATVAGLKPGFMEAGWKPAGREFEAVAAPAVERPA